MRLISKSVAAALAASFLMFGCASPNTTTDDGEWIQLFNGNDLSGWETYIGPELDADRNKIPGSALGLNNDTIDLFTVVEEDGEPAIRVSGVRGAGFNTIDEFENYHLRLQYKWGDETPWPWMSRMDSGLLYHAWGEHGVDNDYWKRSHEFQIMQETSGDYIAIEGATGDIPTRDEDGRYVFDPNGEMRTFSRGGYHPDAVAGAARIETSADYPEQGRWTTVELYAVGDKAVHVVNGTVNMALANSRAYVDGEERPLTRGQIQFQSEGAEVFYRNLEIRHIDEIPADILQAAGLAEPR